MIEASEGECSAPLLSTGQGSAAGDRTAAPPEAVSSPNGLTSRVSDAASVPSPKATPMGNTIWYVPPRPIAEIRALGSSPALVRAEHRSHVQDLAAWLGDVERRSGRTLGSLLASEQREFDRRLAAVKELEKLRPPKLTAHEVLRRLESEN